MAKKITRLLFLVGAGGLGAGLAAARVVRDVRGRDFDPQRTARYLDGLAPSPTQAKRPNFVIMLVDDLGYGDLGVYGSSTLKTPNIDQMAAEGVRMTNFYAAAPVCSPSRAALLTGRYPIRTHITLPLYPSGHPMHLFLSAIDRYRFDVSGIPEDEALLPEILQRVGYRTGMVGKWHLGDRPGHVPNDRGFDSFYGVLYSNDEKPFALYRDGEIEEPAPVEQASLTQKYTREALHFIEENREGPFFLYFSHTAVHEPLNASEGFRGQSAGGLYGDAVAEVDASAGAVLAKLAELGLEEDTLVVFSSDNGPWWQGSPGGLRGRKTNMTEGGFKVPLIARWPGVIPAGAVSSTLGVNFDLLPTFLAAAGIPLPEDRILDGRDLLPAWQGGTHAVHERFFYYDGPNLVAVQQEGWKYHRRNMSDNGGYPTFFHGPFLFDLRRDPNESYSLIETYPEKAREMVATLDEFEAEMEVNVRGWVD